MSCDFTTNDFAPTAGYVVGPSGEQLTEVDANNNWVHTNVYAGGKLIATYDGNVAAPTLHFHIDDPLGTRRAQVSATGALEATYQSLPFGDGLNSIPYTNAGDDDPTENHFTNKERDIESGNDYMFARYYNSATGRFLSPDWSAKVEPVPYAKLENPQTLNLYAYVQNNPVGSFDADGHECKELCQKFLNKLSGNGWKTDAQAHPAPPPPSSPGGPPADAVRTSMMAYHPNANGETVAQIAGRVNHETNGMKDKSGENKPLGQAKEEIAASRMNAEEHYGDKVQQRAGMASSVTSGPGSGQSHLKDRVNPARDFRAAIP
jgi:RHS repeat-associated protein